MKIILFHIISNHGDDITGSASVSRVPGFQDFTSSKVNADRKKRLQPAIPRKQRTFSFEDGMQTNY